MHILLRYASLAFTGVRVDFNGVTKKRKGGKKSWVRVRVTVALFRFIVTPDFKAHTM